MAVALTKKNVSANVCVIAASCYSVRIIPVLPVVLMSDQ